MYTTGWFVRVLFSCGTTFLQVAENLHLHIEEVAACNRMAKIKFKNTLRNDVRPVEG